MKETAAAMMTELKTSHCHKMVLYNHDLVVAWHYENDRIKIMDVTCEKTTSIDLIRFLSKKVFRLIVADIEKNGQNK
jgi:hypothetical protein